MVFQVTPNMLNVNKETVEETPLVEPMEVAVDPAQEEYDAKVAEAVDATLDSNVGPVESTNILEGYASSSRSFDDPVDSTSILTEYPFWRNYSINSNLDLSRSDNFDQIARDLHSRLSFSSNPADRLYAEEFPFPAKDNEYDAEEYTIAQLGLRDNYLESIMAEAGTGLLSSGVGVGAWRLTGDALRTLGVNPKFRVLGQAVSGMSALSFTDSALRDLINDGLPANWTIDPNKRTPGSTAMGTFANVFADAIAPAAYISQQLARLNGPIQLVSDKLRDQMQNDKLLLDPEFLLANPRNYYQKLGDKFRALKNRTSFNARTLGGSVVNDLERFRRTRPTSYGVSEATSITGGAVGAAGATQVDPGDTTTEIVSELAGATLAGLSPFSFFVEKLGALGTGLFNFARHPIQSTVDGAEKVKNWSQNAENRRQAKKEQRQWNFAREYMQALVDATGEDPGEIAAYLISNPTIITDENGRVITELNPAYPGIDPENPETFPVSAEAVHFLRVNDQTAKQTAFLQTNAKALGILQEVLVRGRYGTPEQAVELKSKVKEAADDSLSALQTLTTLLLSTGNPDDVRNVLAARELVIDDQLQTFINRYAGRAQELAAKAGARPVARQTLSDAGDLDPGEGFTLVQEGEILKNAAVETLEASRSIERQLYDGLNFELEPTNLHQALLDMANPTRADASNRQVFMGAASEPVYGPEGSPDAGQIIGYKKVNPTEGHPDSYGDSNEFIRLYQRVGSRPEEREVPAVLSKTDILAEMKRRGITRGNTDSDTYDRIRDEEYGYPDAPSKTIPGSSYTYGVGLDDPFLASNLDIDIENSTQTLTMPELIGKRSDFLEKVRRFRAEGRYKEANAYGTLADAISKDLIDYENVLLGVEDLGKADSTGKLFEWDDLSEAQKKQVGENFLALNEPEQQLIIANQFSRRLHDVFSRTFGGDLVGTDLAGAPALQPEDIINIMDKPNLLKELVRERQFKKAIKQLVLPDPEDGIYDPRAIYDNPLEGAGARIYRDVPTGELRIGEPSTEVDEYGRLVVNEVNAAVDLADKLRTMESAYDFTLQSILANRALDPLDPSVFQSGNTQATMKKFQELQSIVEVIFPGSVFAKDFGDARKVAVKMASLQSKQAEINKLREKKQGVYKLLDIKNPSMFFNSFFDPAMENPKAGYAAFKKFLGQVKQFEDNFFPRYKLAEQGLSLAEAKAGLRNIILNNLLKNAGNKVQMGNDVNFNPASLSEFIRMLGYSAVRKGDGPELVLEANVPFGNVEGAKPLILDLEEAGLVDPAFRRQMELVLGKVESLNRGAEGFLSLAPEDPFNRLLRNLAGIVGAGASRRVGAQLPAMGGTLQLPQIGADVARRVVDIVPGSEGADILFSLMDPANKPQLLEMLKSLKIKPSDSPAKQQLDTNKYLNAFLYKGLLPFLNRMLSPGAISAGLQMPFTEVGEGEKRALTNEEIDVIEQTLKEVEEEAPPEGEPLSAAEPVNVRPIDRSLTMLPRPDIRPPQALPRSMGPTSAPTPERMRFAGLFPQDITSGLIRQGALNQGIGSLAG